MLLALLVWERPAAAQIEISTAIPDLSADGAVSLADGKLELSLEQAIEIALRRNLALVVQRYADARAGLDLEQTFGLYDFTLTADAGVSSEASPSVSVLGGALVSTTDGQNWNLGLGRLISTGGSLRVDFNNTRTDSNSEFATVNPSYRSDFDLSFTQPLLRNFGKRVTEYSIEIARTNREISRETFAQQVTSSIQQVVNAYWSLVRTRAQLIVAERSLELARQLHNQNKVRVEVGTLAPLELVQSEAGIATRDEEIIRARAALTDAEDVLRQLLNLDRGTYWDAEIVTTSEAETERRAVVLEEAITRALESRPEVVSKRLSFQNLDLDADFYRNQRLPQLDLSARYGLNGLGGPVTERDFITREILFQAPGGYSDALDQITNADFEGWGVSLSFAYPLQNRTVEAQIAKAEVALDRAAAELEDLELQVVTEVRKAARGLETAGQQIDSARVSRRLQERTLEAEQKRYDNGMSTSYRVLEIQRDLIDATNREVTAITGYRTALADFLRATGTLTEDVGVTIADDGE